MDNDNQSETTMDTSSEEMKDEPHWTDHACWGFEAFQKGDYRWSADCFSNAWRLGHHLMNPRQIAEYNFLWAKASQCWALQDPVIIDRGLFVQEMILSGVDEKLRRAARAKTKMRLHIIKHWKQNWELLKDVRERLNK